MAVSDWVYALSFLISGPLTDKLGGRLAMLVGFVKPEPLQALANILGQPGVTPAVDRTFPLEQVADAMRMLVASQVRGKLVLSVAA